MELLDDWAFEHRGRTIKVTDLGRRPVTLRYPQAELQDALCDFKGARDDGQERTCTLSLSLLADVLDHERAIEGQLGHLFDAT